MNNKFKKILRKNILFKFAMQHKQQNLNIFLNDKICIDLKNCVKVLIESIEMLVVHKKIINIAMID